MLFLIALVLCIPVITFAANGQPFQALQSQIDQLKNTLQNIQLAPGPQGPAGEKGATGLAGAAGLIGPPGVVSGITNIVRGTVSAEGTWLAGDAWGSPTPIQDLGYALFYNVELQTMTDNTIKPSCVVQLIDTWTDEVILRVGVWWDYGDLHYHLGVESATRGPDGRPVSTKALFAFVCIQ